MMISQDNAVFSTMALTGMGYLQAYRHMRQRISLGYTVMPNVIGRTVQKKGCLVGSPFFENGELEEVIADFAFDGDDLMYVFSNGSVVLSTSCIIIN